MEKEEFKQKFIKEHTKKPFSYKSVSGRVISSMDYEKTI